MPTNSVCASSPEDSRRSSDLPGFNPTLLGLIAWAGREPGLTPPNKAVLLAVVAHTDENAICTETDETLARASHTSVPTVQRSLRRLENERVVRRVFRPHGVREVRLIPGEQSPVVVVLNSLPHRKIKQPQPTRTHDHSPVSNGVTGERFDAEGGSAPETERLVELLTALNVTEKVARGLVSAFPDRIIPQIEAHRQRNVQDPAASLVVAIRANWPTEAPKRQPTAEAKREEARKAREDERQAGINAQIARNAFKRAEQEKIDAFWDGLTEDQQKVFDEEAVESSPHGVEIRNMNPNAPLFRALRTAARWEHVRRNLGLPLEVE